MGHCYTCRYYKKYRLGCHHICEYKYQTIGGMAENLPHDKGKTCQYYRDKSKDLSTFDETRVSSQYKRKGDL